MKSPGHPTGVGFAWRYQKKFSRTFRLDKEEKKGNVLPNTSVWIMTIPRTTHYCPADNRLAFTLVELLVVIAIISLLLTLVMPTIQGAMERARQTQCLAHLRSITSIAMQYALDWDNALPPLRLSPDTPSRLYLRYYANGTFTGHHQFLYLLQNYDRGLPTQQWNIWHGPVGDPRVGPWNRAFICPSDRNPNNRIDPMNERGGTKRRISYAVNQSAWAYNPYGHLHQINEWRDHELPIGRVRAPSQTILFMDASVSMNNSHFMAGPRSLADVQYAILPYVTPGGQDHGEFKWAGTNDVLLRHRQQTAFNASFFDGRVQTFEFPNFPDSLVGQWIRQQ